MYRLTQLCLLLGLVFALAAPASATPPDNPLPKGPKDRFGGEPSKLVPEWWTQKETADKLHLTPEVRQKLSDLHFRFKQKLIDLKAEERKAQNELSHLLEAEKLDEDAIQKASIRISTAHCTLQQEMVQFRVNVARLLTQEQRLTLRDLLREQFKNRFHPPGGPPEHFE